MADPKVKHPEATGDEVHRPFRWTPANATARTAINIGAVSADDVGCLAWQTDENSSWIAIATGTGSAKWAQLGSVSSGSITVRAATTANITLSGTQTVDGVALIVGDRCLVKNQSTASANGVYVVASGSWTRATDFDESVEARPMVPIGVSEGTANGNRIFILTTDLPITLGTTSLTFADITVFAVGGDLSGTTPNPTVAKVNGTTYGAGGSLTTGQVPRVTGASSTAYGALDLANANAVAGVLPVGNVDNLVAAQPVALATLLTFSTGAGTADVTAYTVPASPSGSNRFIVTLMTITLETAITGSGTVVVRGGTITGGNELLVDSATWNSSTPVGTAVGVPISDLGTSFPASAGYMAALAASATVKARATTGGGGISAGAAKVRVWGYLQT
jgi:hypothetical protein